MKKRTKIITGCALAFTMLAVPFAFTGCGDKTTGIDLISGQEKVNYATFAEAYENAASGDTIKLNRNVSLDSPLLFDKNLILDGQNKFTIQATGDWSGVKDPTLMFVDANTNANVTFKNIKIDANGKGRVLVAKSGLIKVDNSTFTGGYIKDNFVAGVYITHAASFEMTGGKIINNVIEGTYAADEYCQFSADLWIGANATGVATITGGEIGNVFVNSNEYSANNPGSFTYDGGKIGNLYVEYDAGYGATFKYVSGEIENLYISTAEGGGNKIKVESEAGYIYKGGAEKEAIV